MKYTEVMIDTGHKHEWNINERNDFVGSGGEKKIYVQGGVAFGVYHNPQTAISIEKCKELSALPGDQIIRPKGILYKGAVCKKNHVGETMLAVHDPIVLCSLFTKAYCERNGIDVDHKSQISQQMNSILRDAHAKQIYVVDNNENNWLISGPSRKVYAIDVGNWQTKSFPATMIMLNIRDPYNPPGERADWYAQAILLANLFIGKHPFEASHPDYDHLPKMTTENGVVLRPRMKAMMEAGVSFFNAKCNLNRACYPLDSIPAKLAAWLRSTLETAERNPPPTTFGAVEPERFQPDQIIQLSRKFDLSLIERVQGEIVSVCASMPSTVIVTSKGWYVDKYQLPFPQGSMCKPTDYRIGFTEANKAVLGWIQDGNAYFSYCAASPTVHGVSDTDQPRISARYLLSVSGRLIVVSGDKAMEVRFYPNMGGVAARVTVVGQVVDLPAATKVYDGCLIQNLLGTWVSYTFPRPGRCLSTRLQDIENSQVIDAKYNNGALMVLAVKNKIYSQYLYFEDGDELKLARVDHGVSLGEMNWTVNDRGTLTRIENDGELLAMKTNTLSPTVTIIDDPAITTDMKLVAIGNKTHFYRGQELYSLSVKP